MKRKEKVIAAVIQAALILSTSGALLVSTSVLAHEEEQEKCYGVVKAGMNDCATATASCAGSSTKDGQSDAFVFVTKGLCDKLVGGSKTVTKVKKSK